MVEQIFHNIFRIEIPLPANPLKAINSYVIKGNGRCLIIDTGMNREECRQAMNAGLEELSIDLQRTDFFITHLHADHFGLIYGLARESSKVYFNAPDAKIVNDPGHWNKIIENALVNGFPEEDLQSAIQKHPGRRYQSHGSLELTLLKDGDQLALGDYVFHCVGTPGHTPGHLCLYEPDTKIFFSGDHILEDITPNISTWPDCQDSLQQYLDSLDKIHRFEISWVFPGHRRTFKHYRKRIAELKRHHETRANEVLSILKSGSQSAYQVASQMTWDIDCEKWEDFPIMQKWFATGEALSHLQYLQNRRRVKSEMADGHRFFALSP